MDNAYVEFTGDIRLVTARAIEAATGFEVTDLAKITFPYDLTIWKGKRVAFFATNHGEYSSILHPTGGASVPWGIKYPNALALVKGLDVQIKRILSLAEWTEGVLEV